MDGESVESTEKVEMTGTGRTESETETRTRLSERNRSLIPEGEAYMESNEDDAGGIVSG